MSGVLEKATDPSQPEVDWSLVFQICDVVNNTELGAKEARKLLQKKMLSSDVQTQILSLEVWFSAPCVFKLGSYSNCNVNAQLLDALSENCHAKFSSKKERSRSAFEK